MTLAFIMMRVHGAHTGSPYDGAFVALVVAATVVAFWGWSTRVYGWRFWKWPWRQWFRLR